jgi:hypothetical protein
VITSFSQPRAHLQLDSILLFRFTNQHHQIQLATYCLPYARFPKTPNHYIFTLYIFSSRFVTKSPDFLNRILFIAYLPAVWNTKRHIIKSIRMQRGSLELCCSLVRGFRPFGDTYLLHLQPWRRRWHFLPDMIRLHDCLSGLLRRVVL